MPRHESKLPGWALRGPKIEVGAVGAVDRKDSTLRWGQPTAALRDFNPGYDRSGVIRVAPTAARLRRMSAMPSMATSKADHPVFRGEDVKPGLCEAALLTEIIPRLQARDHLADDD